MSELNELQNQVGSVDDCDAANQAEQLTEAPKTDEAVASSENAATTNLPLLKVEGLKKYFPIQTDFFGRPTRYLRAVDDISFDVDVGKTIGVVGESGCGKTTLGRTILKLYDIDGGKVYFDGNDITDLKKSGMQKYRTDIQLIFQDPYSSLPPRMTIGSIIAEPVRVHKIVPKDQVHSYVLDIMKKCGLKPQHYDRYPHEFSGGQRQRICIARALAVKPKLVICDEPVSALDVSIQAQIINLLKELQQTMGLAYVFISHDLSVVKYITDKILVMYLGNAMELSETDELFDNPLHPYTKALFSAVPAPNPSVKMNRIVLEGDIPSPANPPSGCKFHTRCSECMKVCKFKQPEYIEVSKGHFVACHLYNQEIMSHLADYDDEYDRLEEQKRIDAELAAAKKQNNPFVKLKNRLFKKNKNESVAEEPSVNAASAAEETTATAPQHDENIEPQTSIITEQPVAQETAVAFDKVEPSIAETPEAEKREEAEAPKQDELAAETPTEQSASADIEKPTVARKPRSTTSKSTTAKAATTKKTAAPKSTTASKSTAAKKSTSTKSAPSQSATAKKTTAPKSTTASKSTAAKKTTSSSKSATTAKTSTAKSATSKSTAASKSASTKKTTGAKTAADKPTSEKPEVQAADSAVEQTDGNK